MEQDEKQLSIGRMAESACNAFCRAMEGMGNAEPQPRVGEAWSAVAEHLAGIQDGEYGVAELAEACVRVYNRAVAGDETLTFAPPMPDQARVAWQAAVCHLYGLVCDYGGEPLRELEAKWSDWAADRLAGHI